MRMSVAWPALLLAMVWFGVGNVLAQWSHALAARGRAAVLIAAIGCQVVSMLLFAAALTAIPLAIAYPLAIGGNVAVVSVLGAVVLRQRLSRAHLLGLLSILLGMALIDGGSATASATGQRLLAAAHSVTAR